MEAHHDQSNRNIGLVHYNVEDVNKKLPIRTWIRSEKEVIYKLLKLPLT